MLAWIIRIVGGLALLIVIGAGALAVMTLEFGERPASSLKPFEITGDIKFVEANGIRFAYIEEGQGPLVLLFHGYPETARSWKVVQQRLAQSGYRAVAPYMRGYPPTALAADGDYTTGALARDVLGLIDAFGAQSATVVGHDWGAAAVYAAAAKEPTKIDRLVALAIPHPRGVLGDPTVFLRAPHFLYYQLPIAERLVWSRDFVHIESIYRQWAPGYRAPPEVLNHIKATLRAPGATAGVLGYYWSLFKRDPAEMERSAASEIAIPTLIIAGADDGAVGLERYEKARAAFTGDYRFVALKGVGHFPQLEAAEKTADEIVALLQSAQ